MLIWMTLLCTQMHKMFMYMYLKNQCKKILAFKHNFTYSNSLLTCTNTICFPNTYAFFLKYKVWIGADGRNWLEGCLLWSNFWNTNPVLHIFCSFLDCLNQKDKINLNLWFSISFLKAIVHLCFSKKNLLSPLVLYILLKIKQYKDFQQTNIFFNFFLV